MRATRYTAWTFGFLVVISGLLAACSQPMFKPDTRASAAAPRYAVDPSWPKPLPADWVLGQVAGLAQPSRSGDLDSQADVAAGQLAGGQRGSVRVGNPTGRRASLAAACHHLSRRECSQVGRRLGPTLGVDH